MKTSLDRIMNSVSFGLAMRRLSVRAALDPDMLFMHGTVRGPGGVPVRVLSCRTKPGGEFTTVCPGMDGHTGTLIRWIVDGLSRYAHVGGMRWARLVNRWSCLVGDEMDFFRAAAGPPPSAMAAALDDPKVMCVKNLEVRFECIHDDMDGFRGWLERVIAKSRQRALAN